ncbi:MAG TPA: hypothetical protein VFM58_18750 [Solirubrobacteraceae bacterium]|jgi:hypothetical protein|nr:hypothetical protein [Solirubrobacteraceae bacterium]
MTHVLTRSPAIRRGENTIDWHAQRPAADPHGLQTGADPHGLKPGADPTGPTLADVVARAWEVLGAELPACCPVCGGEMLPQAAGGRCGSCGSTLT